MVLNIIYFHTNFLLSPHAYHQIDLLQLLPDSCITPVGTMAHPVHQAGWQTGLKEPHSCLCASWGTELLLDAGTQPRACTELVFPGNNTWVRCNLDESGNLPWSSVQFFLELAFEHHTERLLAGPTGWELARPNMKMQLVYKPTTELVFNRVT